MSDKAIIEKIEDYKYNVPVYTVIDGEGIRLAREVNTSEIKIPDMLYIQMVRGSKLDEENKEVKYDGVLVEQLIAVCIDHLETVNVGELKNEYTEAAIDALKEVGLFLLVRETRRKEKQTLGTYQK